MLELKSKKSFSSVAWIFIETKKFCMKPDL